MAPKKKSTASAAGASNRKARRDYQVLQSMEAGIELRGTEVKSIRQGHISLEEGFAVVERGEILLHGVHIQPYDHGNQFNHDPVRPRRLLLHKGEIERLQAAVQQKGCTMIPLKVYFTRGRAKVELGVCKGKLQQDKREDMKRKTADREARRAISAQLRRR